VTIPESHLAQEAIAALVDGELPSGPATRAARHLEDCLLCRMAVAAQREAKEALHDSADVTVPGDLVSRLCAIPFTTDVPGDGGGSGTLSAGRDELLLSGTSGSWSLDLHPQESAQQPGHARWLRRGLAGALVGLGAGVTALALNLPPDGAVPGGPVARPSAPEQHTQVVPPVVRTLTVGSSSAAFARTGGTP
jgi:anti-sigma factor RsiW